MKPADLPDAELLVREGIDAAKAGDHARAIDLLSQALTIDERNVRAWLWLSSAVEAPRDKAFCLRRVLALDPGNEFAREGMAWLRAQDHGGERGLVPAQDTRQAKEQDRSREQGPLHELRKALGAGPTRDAATPNGGSMGTRVEWIASRRARERARRARSDPLRGPRPLFAAEFVLIAILGLLLLVLIARGVSGLPAPLPLLRLLLGLAFVLFVPGYALQATLFPQADALDGPERLALSFGLSLAVVPLLALLLDWLPWGLSLWPIVIGEGLIITIFSLAAIVRRWRLPAEERPVLAPRVELKGWWAVQDRTNRVLYGVLAGALLLALVSAAAIILLPKPGERFTEFYLLGPDGLAESYPREAAPGQALSVTAGIANREGEAAEYRVEIQVDGEPIGAAEPVLLEDGEVWEAPLTYALPQAGDDQQVKFLLYRDGGQEPYRRLRLWINVVEAPGSDE